MLVINSIEKSRLHADSFSYSGSGVAWKARFVLFLGFALLAGGLAGSVVSSIYGFFSLCALLTLLFMPCGGMIADSTRRSWFSSILSSSIRCRHSTSGLQTLWPMGWLC